MGYNNIVEIKVLVVSVFSPLIGATGAAVKRCHGFISGPDLKLVKVCPPMFTLFTSDCCRVRVFPHFFAA